jgi:hypothetical protein
VDRRKRQTATASPAKPGGLPLTLDEPAAQNDHDRSAWAVNALSQAGPWAQITRNGSGGIIESEIREALDRHWAASDANDLDVEHDIYREDALLEYAQSGERIRGRRNIRTSRIAQPNAKLFQVRPIVGASDLWVTEFILSNDGRPSCLVSVMESLDGKVAR